MNNLIGKTIAYVSYPSQHENITLTFTDGTIMVVREVGYTGEIEVRLEDKVIKSEHDLEG